AIEAIRGQGEVKLKAKKVHLSKLTRKTFGVPGELALKAMTRNRRNFRATVIALSSSVVLFLVGTTFGSSIMVAATELYPGVEATAMVNLSFAGYNDDTGPYYNEEAAKDPTKKQPPEFEQAMLDAYLEKLQAYGGGTKVRMIGQNLAYATYDAILTEEAEFLTDGKYSEITIVSLDRETYLEVIKQAGAKDGQAVVLNHLTYRFGDQPRTILRPFKFTKGTMNIITYADERQIEIGGTITEIPQELRLNMKGMFYVLTQNFPANEVDFYADVQDSAGFVAYAEAAYGELKHADSQYRININAQDIKGEIAATRGLVTLIMLFVYGFIAMLTLIGLTNVISTISTNIRLRAREFAVLVSMGMTQRGIMRMISYESLLCGLRALVFGLIAGLGLSYVIYIQMTDLVRFPYEFPQVPVMIAVLAVFAVTFVTMRFSAARVRRGNVMEAIRGSE
ncbi:MAG: ABC transporter permease, partial [Oscillospiraceae bacterium]|nr:ABC transporter permease [Oscillospiraceae bacterium]